MQGAIVRVIRYMENKGDPVDTEAEHPQLMTARQVAVLLLMRESTVQDYARRGVLPSIKLGRHRRFLRSDVLAAVEQLRHSA